MHDLVDLKSKYHLEVKMVYQFLHLSKQRLIPQDSVDSVVGRIGELSQNMGVAPADQQAMFQNFADLYSALAETPDAESTVFEF